MQESVMEFVADFLVEVFDFSQIPCRSPAECIWLCQTPMDDATFSIHFKVVDM
jgi:hypothetical protein